MPGSRIFYFENDFEAEEARAEEMRKAAAKAGKAPKGKAGKTTAAYPRTFDDSDALLDADNALKLLYDQPPRPITKGPE